MPTFSAVSGTVSGCARQPLRSRYHAGVMRVRKLWGTPHLAAEWNDDYEEHAASWWELFVDLVLVATCSTVAESFEEDVSFGGLQAFVVTFILFVQGWAEYSQFSSRFIDSSLLHSFQLFLYLLATSYMVTNTSGFEYLQDFAWSVVLQRCTMLFMFSTTYVQLPRARSYLLALSFSCSITTLVCAIAAFSPSTSVGKACLSFAAIWESLAWWPIFGVLIRKKVVALIPANIDHNTERFGCLIMVVLGESVISALFDYHRSVAADRTPAYLAAMALSMTLTFSLGLIFYAVAPERDEHAMRLSMPRGMGFTIAHTALSASLLAVGVGVKLAMHSLSLQPRPSLPPAHAWLLFAATSVAMAAILVIRLCHYGGREPKPSDPAHVRRLKLAWWAFLSLSVLAPAAAGAAVIAPQTLDPTWALKVIVGVVLSYALGETAVQHVLVEYLAPHGSAEVDEGGEGEGEGHRLLGPEEGRH